MAVDHLALALVDLVGHHPHEAFVAVHIEVFDGLENRAVLVLLQDDFGTAHGELEAFPAHGFHKDGHLELAAALDDEGIVVVGHFQAYGHIAQRFLLQAVLDDPALQKLALPAGQGRGVDADADGHGGLVHGDAGQCGRMFPCADGIANGHVLDAGQNHDVAGIDPVHFFKGHALIDLQLGGAQGTGIVVGANAGQGLVVEDGAVEDAANGQAAQIVGIVQIGHQHLEGLVGIVFWSGNLAEDGFKEGLEILALVVLVVHGNAVAAHGIEHGEFQLFVVGAEVDEEIVDFVEHFLDAGVLAVDLVDDHHHGQAGLQGLAQHKACLWQRAFGGIHQQDGAAGHGQGAFHLAAKVRVAGGVDDVDFDTFPADGAVLGGNGDAAFAFQIHVVHDAVIDLLIRTEHAALAEHGIHQGGLAVVNVGYDGNIAQFFIFHRHALPGTAHRNVADPWQLPPCLRIFVRLSWLDDR